jgi:hypothetical protein
MIWRALGSFLGTPKPFWRTLKTSDGTLENSSGALESFFGAQKTFWRALESFSGAEKPVFWPSEAEIGDF